jgi:hypothetical protein
MQIDYSAIIAVAYVLLGLGIVALATGLLRRRARWVVIGTVLAAPVCLLLSYLFWVAPVAVVLVILLANCLSAWVLRRGWRTAGAVLLLPFTVLVLATVFTVPIRITDPSTTGVAVGDLDHDGDPDLVLARGHHSPRVNLVLLNDGRGRFEQRNLSDIADNSFSVSLADVTGDDNLDVIIGNDRNSRNVVYFGDSMAHFTLAGSFGDSAWNTRVVLPTDLDADGDPDLVVANRDRPNQPGGTYICPNDGRGKFPSCRLLLQQSANRIAAGDLNGDDAPDLVVPHGDRGQSYIFINDGQGGFEQRRPFGPPSVEVGAIALGDLDGDGRLDIVMAATASPAFAYFNRGGGQFSEGVPLGHKRDRVFAAEVADLNRDGEADVVLGLGRQPAAVLLNDGEGRSFTRLNLGDGDGNVWGLGVADLNGDGFPDIVAGRVLAPNMIYLNALNTTDWRGKNVKLQWHPLTGPVR